MARQKGRLMMIVKKISRRRRPGLQVHPCKPSLCRISGHWVVLTIAVVQEGPAFLLNEIPGSCANAKLLRMKIWQEKDKMAFLAAIKGLRDKDKAKEKAWDLADSAEFQCRLGGISQNLQLEARRKKTKKSSSSRSPSVRKAPICFG